jgi:colanic acid biosynthesis glycosyl transferase WcaI
MKILILAQHFSPEEVSGSLLATELATDLQALGHQVTIVTGVPNYPFGIAYPGYKNSFIAREVLNEVNIIRVWSYISPKRTVKKRLLNYLSFSIMAVLGCLFAGKQDVLLCYSPPFSLGLTGLIVSRFLNSPWIFRVEDLYPESAIATGYVHNIHVIRFLTWIEKVFYSNADHISLITESFRRNLLNKNVPAEKLSVIPVWADSDKIFPLPRTNQLRAELDLDGQFVVLYSGNMGQTSDLEGVVYAADQLKSHPEIEFLFVGEGIKKQELQKLRDHLGLSHVRFYPFFSQEKYSELLALSNICIVTINKESAEYSMPMKTFSVLASGRPIMAIAPETCELSKLVRETGCGVVISPENINNLAETILEYSKNLHLDEMGLLGRKKLEQEYSRKIVICKFEEMLLSVTEKNGSRHD